MIGGGGGMIHTAGAWLSRRRDYQKGVREVFVDLAIDLRKSIQYHADGHILTYFKVRGGFF